MPLTQLLDRVEFASLSICRSGAEWQASLQVSRGSFRIRVGATPSEALAALFEPVPTALPPLPY